MRKKVKEMIGIIEADGWFFTRQKGSHRQFKHLTKKGIVTIPDHGKNDDLEHFYREFNFKTSGAEIIPIKT